MSPTTSSRTHPTQHTFTSVPTPVTSAPQPRTTSTRAAHSTPPRAAPQGNLTYGRGHIKVSQEVAKAVTRGEAVIVIHGVDHNHNGVYDGTTASDLDPSLPTEATDPALCGVVVPN